MVANHLIREDMVPVDLSAILIYLLAVYTGRTPAGFEMKRYAGKVGKFVGAPGAFDSFANVNGGVEELQSISKWSIRLVGHLLVSRH